MFFEIDFWKNKTVFPLPKYATFKAKALMHANPWRDYLSALLMQSDNHTNYLKTG
jgi:hypothetical protein